MAKQYYLTKIGYDTFLVPEQIALNYINKKEFEVVKRINEMPDTPFFYGKRLKAFIETGYDTKNKKIMYYKVTCYCKRHEVIDYKIFDTSKIPMTDYKGINEVYQKAVEYAEYYLNHCKY